MNPFNITLVITPHFSKRLFLIMIFVALISVIVSLLLPISIILKILACLLIIVCLYHSLREHCWHLGRAIQSARLRKDNSWLLSIAGEDEVRAELLPGCLVQPWLTVLVFRLPNRRKVSLLLLKDNAERDSFRRLRVRLKHPI